MRRYDRLALPTAAMDDLPVKPGGVYLITGGLGGIGLALANWLVQWRSVRLLLTGRTALPKRADWDRALTEQAPDSSIRRTIAAIRDLEAAGGEVIAAQADAADSEQMQAAVALARSRWGEIDGVIHAAGVAGDGRLAILKSPADVEAVLSPKVKGLAVLARLLGDRPLDFVALMSSINAVVGAPGVCDYAAANAVLDAFADSDERPASWRKVVAFDWAPWRDVGMAANFEVAERLRARWQENVRSGIPTPAGIDIFTRVLAAGPRRVVVVPYDLVEAGQLARTAAVIADRAKGEAGAQQVAPKVASKPGTGSSTEISLAEIWSELLGVSKIDPDANFFELGGHSLLATRMMARIYEIFGVHVSLRAVFDAPTVRTLALRISSAQLGSSPSVSEGEEEAGREELIF